MLITNLPLCLIEEQPLQRQKRPDHVFADSLGFFLGLSPDLAVNVETCVAPAEDLLHKGKADELFPVKIIKEHPVKNRVFRMTLAVDPWHSREADSRNGPGGRNEPQRLDIPGKL